MDFKYEIRNIMLANSDRLLNSMGQYVQCVIEDDWNDVAIEILTLLQSNDAGQPNGSKPTVSGSFYNFPTIIEPFYFQYRVVGQDGSLPVPLFYGTYAECVKWRSENCR